MSPQPGGAASSITDTWLASVALFLATNAVGYYACYTHHLHETSDDDKTKRRKLSSVLEEEEEENEQDDDESNGSDSVFYFHRRLEHRLSFPKYPETQPALGNDRPREEEVARRSASFDSTGPPTDQTPNRSTNHTVASQYSINCYPRNSNWKHFECFDPSSNDNKSNQQQQPQQRESQEPNPLLPNSVEETVKKGNMVLTKESSTSGSAIYMSLEGERVAKRKDEKIQHNPRGSSSQSIPTSEDESYQCTSTDDDEDEDSTGARESHNLFAWVGGQKLSSNRRRNNKYQKSKLKQKAPSLPIILSERNMLLSTTSSSDTMDLHEDHDVNAPSGSMTPLFVSQPSSLQGSVTDAGDDDDDDENSELLYAGDESDHGHSRNLVIHSAPASIAPTPDTSRHRDNNEEKDATESSPDNPDVRKSVAFFGRSLSSFLGGNNNASTDEKDATNHDNTAVKLPPPPNRKRLTARSTSAPLMRSDSTHTASSARARANYNARIMPNKLILVRHGQSMGNLDETLYSRTADNSIPLTELGWLQAREAGKQLRRVLKGSSDVHFIVSPYVRTVETFHGIAAAWLDPNDEEFKRIKDPVLRRKAWYSRLVDLGLSWAEDPRIREQDFGNLQDPAKVKQYKKERNTFGAFYYRFAHGESAADVFDRISTFLDSLWRSFDVHPARNFVLITHGISIRVLLARYFRYTIDQFHLLSNPRNCEMIVMKHDGNGRLEMAGRHELETIPQSSTSRSPEGDKSTNITSGKDETVHKKDGCDVMLRYKYHKRLRVLPPEFVRKVKIRICYEEDATA
uniref:Uncharacterized protein n=1 Tax=Entomoneis paludosa TaxID=265537 RepID=A0A7S2YRS4_9STRA|mmetsp:Transcript_7461/g.15576  ORF Transcript_7461/g.15576 Transcript_7461/m.15576 type:complete len:798 (+) Transcript_7461:209-2602(+)|eukprot:CAMPEP_0172454438 /NCGR_PEP_ID=MMETSP1065-20121228/11426_1 /TAXON_ID=265537 /ORGANISM="Amphiprora paludosa, Strain CCMP125" /LENGTH=797 /DNA_ID=CAMNT_0013206765 /DNA_START=154 /DNA_END=2547 /DNA_ORIENTATION=-